MAAGLTLLLLVLAGVFKSKVDTSRPSASIEPSMPPGATEEVRVIHRPRFQSAVGSVEPVHEAAVASKLLARVVEVKVRAGQAVKEGDVLVRLDDAELRTRLNQAESAVRSAKLRHDA